ncbi:MAG: C39 family peptidase [Acutalibacteraceae bacterium]|nr:C39 family peptidase [Acutalibacteraceae bacterium]
MSEAETIKPSNKSKLLSVQHISQRDNWPTGCESVSAVMALNYAGIDISVDDFINNYLEKTTAPFNPNLSFGGSPYDSGGWGLLFSCH